MINLYFWYIYFKEFTRENVKMFNTYGAYVSCPSREISSTSLSSKLSTAMGTVDAILWLPCFDFCLTFAQVFRLNNTHVKTGRLGTSIIINRLLAITILWRIIESWKRNSVLWIRLCCCTWHSEKREGWSTWEDSYFNIGWKVAGLMVASVITNYKYHLITHE